MFKQKLISMELAQREAPEDEHSKIDRKNFSQVCPYTITVRKSS
jgi:hypothetical protein